MTAMEAQFKRLRRFNFIVGLVHLAQVLVIIALSNDFSLSVTESFAAGPPGSTPPNPDIVWDMPLGLVVALFLALAAIDHLLMSAPLVRDWYEKNLAHGINYARWWEYSISASVMIVIIAMITGITDLAALIAIFGVNASMIFFGMVMEIFNREPRDDVNWTPFLFGSVAGMVPWLAIVAYLVGAEMQTGGSVPNFVYGIFASLFVFFNCFAVNMILQYKKIGPWRDYLYGERAYIILSLVAKTALAWQVFANTLMD